MELSKMSDAELEKFGIKVQNDRDKLNQVLMAVASEKDARYLKDQASKKVAAMSDEEKAAVLRAMGVRASG